MMKSRKRAKEMLWKKLLLLNLSQYNLLCLYKIGKSTNDEKMKQIEQILKDMSTINERLSE